MSLAEGNPMKKKLLALSVLTAISTQANALHAFRSVPFHPFSHQRPFTWKPATQKTSPILGCAVTMVPWQ